MRYRKTVTNKDVRRFFLAVCAVFFFPQAPELSAQAKKREYTINVDVDMVVMRVTVRDKKGNIVNDLGPGNFRILEDKVLQKPAVVSHADIPLVLGLAIDGSGSMRPKRDSVMLAARSFVRASNPADQVFIVNFNDVYYLETRGEFVSKDDNSEDAAENLDEALEKVFFRGRTAIYESVYASIEHATHGKYDRRAIIVITDGDDNESKYSVENVVAYAQKNNVAVYAIGLTWGDDEEPGLFKIGGGYVKRAAKSLKKFSEITGGEAVFPKKPEDVAKACERIANDIRNQYTIAYYPTNKAKDGTFRVVQIEAVGDRGEKFKVSARPGYYAISPKKK